MCDGATVLDILDAIYAVEPAASERSWLDGLREASRGALDHVGTLAYSYRVEPERVALPIVVGDAPLTRVAYHGDLAPLHAAGSRAGRMSELYARQVGAPSPRLPPALRSAWREHGLEDMFGVFAATCEREGQVLGFGLPASRAARPTDWRRTQRTWTGLAHHIARAARVRRHLAHGTPAAEFDGEGRGEFTGGAARERQALRAAAAGLDALRREADPVALVDHWEALLAGRWSIVRTRAHGGRIRFVAVENPDAGAPLRALSGRERVVVGEVARGSSSKAIAIDLGVTESAVAMLLARALRKLGLERREHLPRLAAALSPRR
jgi:DNA-binding CsgD family transcriptional regulator